MKKPLTIEARDRATDKRIQKKFGITLAERNRRAAEQDHKCKICDGPLDAYGPPALDHFHFRVKVYRHTDEEEAATGLKWVAQSYDERGQVVFIKRARTKDMAIADVKRETMPWSLRSLLCFKCNYGLGCIERFFDAAAHPEHLFPVIEYLRTRLK